MQVIDVLKQANKPVFSLEITPPEKGKSIQGIFDTIDMFKEFKPHFINVTYHQQRVVYIEKEGIIKKIPIRKNVGTVGICSAIKHKYGIETVPHLICGGFNKYDTEDALIDLNFLGMENLLVLRGDPQPEEKEFVPEKEGYKYAYQLVKQVSDMNQGKYLEDLDNGHPTHFCIGVAGYPEKHWEAPNMEQDLLNLKNKVDQGADYVITQMCFKVNKFKEFVKKARAVGINVPIIPGIKPFTNRKQLASLPINFHISLPQDLVQEILQASSKEAVRQAGIEYTIYICKELLKFGVPGIHFFSLGQGKDVHEVVQAIF